MGNAMHEDDELYEDEEDIDPDYVPVVEITPEVVAGISELSSVGEAKDFDERLEENMLLFSLRQRARAKAERIENLKKAHSAPRCQHTKANGHTCHSPAVSGQAYCHYHCFAYSSATTQIPIIEDRRSYQIALMRVCQQIANGTLDPKQAKILIEALTIAKNNATSQPTEGCD